MPCEDCNQYPKCINFPDGTWKTVYNEAQEEIVKQHSSAKEVDMDSVVAKANELVLIALANKKKQQELEEEAKDQLIAQQIAINQSKPQDAIVIPKEKKRRRTSPNDCVDCG
jgi:hypothetical protein